MFSLLSRLGNVVKGWFGLGVSALERRNPEALLELEKENLRKQMAQYNQGLATHAGMCERLMAQVRKLESDERDLRAKAGAHLKAGNREAAGQYALRLQTVQRELTENKTQLEQAEGTYKNLTKARDVAISAAKAKLDSLKGAIEDMKMKKAMAEMSEMASGMISKIGGSGDTMSRLTEMVDEERNKAAGRARVARDSMDMSEVNLKEAEQAALADQALADFAAKEGMVLDAKSPAPAPVASEPLSSGPVKSMGPQATTG